MTLLLNLAELEERRALLGAIDAAGGAQPLAPLAVLADALAAGLEPLIGREETLVPALSAQLSREGGRCPHDGTLLDFDPWSAHEHRCPRCGDTVSGERHHRNWLYWYHLWLAERVLHASLLWRLRGDERHLRLATRLLRGYARRYPDYPNRDNLLGPSRVFFSTYLESIWLLQLVLGADLLRAAPAAHAGDGDTEEAVSLTIERIVEPSVELIASFDEGGSNRQVWNGAALMAAGALLGRPELAEHAVHGASGLVSQLRTGLLADGSWYEGENYHLFAHRGLWYGVHLAERLGLELPPDAVSRFDAGFLAPLATVLPDLTLPSRRDSQYAISLRQPRFAEMAELGFARTRQPVLASLLHALYDGSVERREPGQGSSTADVERNVAPTALARADLGWRTLLFASPELPYGARFSLRSALLPAQGIAVFRRRAGAVYAALDYGRSGGGHGHPDRLNVLLMDGRVRWLDDVGTGSYVERTLHWYRSTLAHNAPLVDGRSQQRVDGTLLAHEERGAAGWVVASAPIAPGVVATRTLVVLDDYLVDEVHWTADRGVTVDLPLHLAGASVAGDATHAGHRPATLAGASGLEDGFEFVRDASVAPLAHGQELRLHAERDGRAMQVVLRCDADTTAGTEWWRATAPAPPPAPGIEAPERTDFHVLRQRGTRGSVRAIWSWTPGAVARFGEHGAEVTLADGTRHVHRALDDGRAHRIDLSVGIASSSIDLGGWRPRHAPHAAAARSANDAAAASHQRAHEHAHASALPFVRPRAHFLSDEPADAHRHWFTRELGAPHYRRSEQSWEEAGSPSARVALGWTGASLVIDVAVRKREEPVFAPADAVNPYDNEHPDIDGDGVQLYVRGEQGGGAWILVPETEGGVRVRALQGWSAGSLAHDARVQARWRRTPEGWELRAELALAATGAPSPIALDVLVNETAPGRERRRGQLLLSGGGDWLYLRGDRHDPSRLLHFVLTPS